jgi:carbonic anhydrase
MTCRHGALPNLLALAAVPVIASAAGHHWSYSGETGPSHWAGLEPGYAACGIGKAQSPIDIKTADVRRQKMPPLSFHYEPTSLHVIDNGHTIQVNLSLGNSLAIAGDRYQLVQFHFHHPSEERIDGKQFDMVVHLVHRDSQGHLAVVAVPLRSGAPNPLLAKLWRALPHQKGKEESPAGVVINVADLLPADLGYYNFPGSLTTPPCSEGVRWFVLKSPKTVSPEQLAAFAKLYPDNARTPQPLNGRVVLSSE